ncbi:DUF485 domain-containing protein [Azospirillum agricola]|uniref:DUF485 domain-containing protein n=1 Tax=Azospirillum agricola TaxID=1720247 RepID=UPI000A0F2A3F|nr:DUF485 domain-containing protein [Azospirillum agricola]SMH39852.1 Uncharacterized membrane protein, DUF485 family [Azospirillum lipoferum]
MSNPVYERVRRNPKFHELVRKRSRLALGLSAIVLVAYYAFMMVVAFAPQTLHAPLGEGSALSVGFPIGAAIIVVSWLLTGVYSHFANGEFEDLNQDITRETLR